MDDDVIDIFSRERLSIKQPLSKPPKQRKCYTAYEVSETPQIFLSLHMHYGAEILLNSTYLSEAILYTDHCCLDLIFKGMDCAAIITGEHLKALIEPLREGKLKTLYCYNEQEYLKPKPGQLVITRISEGFAHKYYELKNRQAKERNS